MDYFKKLQLVKYDFTTSEDVKQYFTLVDITTRIQSFYNDEDIEFLFDDYNIKNWDTPEKISYSLYGTTEYYWTILYINDIFDMYNDWPLSEVEIQKYAESLYPGYGPSPTNTYAVEVLPYVSGQTQIKLSPVNTVSEEIIIYPDKIQAGMFVDRYIAGEDCRVVSVEKVYKPGGLFIIDYYLVEIDKLTQQYVKDVSVSSIGNINSENVIFFNFAAATEEYNTISYYMNPNGTIKDLEYANVGERLYGITKLDDLTLNNEKKKRIKIIRPAEIGNFVKTYFNKII